MPLTGTFPDEWGVPTAFQALQILRINFNDIEGEVRGWRVLRAETLACCFSPAYINTPHWGAGTLPATWAARGAFPRLQDLRFHVTKLSGEARWNRGD